MWMMIAALFASAAGTTYSDFIADKNNVRFCVAASEALVTWQRGLGNNPDETMPYASIGKLFQTGLEKGDPELAALRKSIARDAAWGDRYQTCRQISNSAEDGKSLAETAEVADLFNSDTESGEAAIAAANAIAAGEESGAAEAAAAEAEMAALEAENAAASAKRDAREAMGKAALVRLSPTQRGQVRCVMLAQMVMAQVERGGSKRSYGLTRAKADTLAARFAMAIAAETGMTDADVQAAYKQDFEDFTFVKFGDGGSEQSAQKMLDGAMAQCQPLYARSAAPAREA